MQVCRRDWLNGLWTLWTFRYFSGIPFRLILLQDGSLSRNDWDELARRLPGLIQAGSRQIAEGLAERLEPLAPEVVKMRRLGRFVSLPKVVDAWLLAERPVSIVLDPDVLFFGRPDELLGENQALGGGMARLNFRPGVRHHDGCYCLDVESLARSQGIEFRLGFSTGLGLVAYPRIPWAEIGHVFGKLPLVPGREFMLDQTILALACALRGHSTLDPKRYAIDPVPDLDGVVARHYFAKTRDLMYVEGFPHLRRLGFHPKLTFR
jgi:hypothetical protein